MTVPARSGFRATPPKPPADIAPYMDVLGQDLTVQFLLKFGGAELYTPSNPKGQSQIEALVGAIKTQKLAKADHLLPHRVSLADQSDRAQPARLGRDGAALSGAQQSGIGQIMTLGIRLDASLVRLTETSTLLSAALDAHHVAVTVFEGVLTRFKHRL
ncbi:MAG: hypothetical protein AB8B51_14040 [Sedimentitalea sp.]